MLVSDLKTIVEIMELAGGSFPVVKIAGFNLYATNGIAMAVRGVEFKEEGFIKKSDLPMLKAILTRDKKEEFTKESLANFIDAECDYFPTTEQVKAAFEQKFEYEINFNADALTKILKAMKSKNNEVIMKINGNKSPFIIVHENGNGLIQPIT